MKIPQHSFHFDPISDGLKQHPNGNLPVLACDHIAEVARLKQIIAAQNESIKKLKPTTESLFIVRYDKYDSHGEYDKITVYTEYAKLDKLLCELSEQNTICNIQVFSGVAIPYEKVTKFSFNLPT